MMCWAARPFFFFFSQPKVLLLACTLCLRVMLAPNPMYVDVSMASGYDMATQRLQS